MIIIPADKSSGNVEFPEDAEVPQHFVGVFADDDNYYFFETEEEQKMFYFERGI